MKLSDISFEGPHYYGFPDHSEWICEKCGKEVKDIGNIEAGDILTCPHCDSTYFVEED